MNPRWKVILVYIICTIGIIFVFPNFLPEKQHSKLPDWYRATKLSLGLDLRGGSQLLLEVDFNSYLKEKIENSKDELRTLLREKKIGYISLRALGNQITLSLRENDDFEQLRKIVRSLDRNFVVTKNDKDITISLNEEALNILKGNLIEQSIEIVRRRVDSLGTTEPVIQKQGDNKILLQIPGLESPDALKNMLGKTAKLTFHLVDEVASLDSALRGNIPLDSMLLSGEKDEQYYILKKKVMLSGDMLTDARATIVDNNRVVVAFKFNSYGARKFGELTKNNVGHHIAIVLDNKVISAPSVSEPITGGSGIITGNFNAESAGELATLLRAGALPVPLKIIEERTVGPSLGSDSIKLGMKAMMLSFILVMTFMIFTYGPFGFVANIALILNICFIISLLSILGATLSLPGIAGIVLTIGMAVDANVLFFERIREELRSGLSPRKAVERGFEQGFRTVFDSNITTMIAGLFLFIFGAGTIKNFAVTLSIGITCSMFTAITLSRMIINYGLNKFRPEKIRL